MWIRSRLDIGWSDIMAAFGSCLVRDSREAACRAVTDVWGENRNIIATLSVRSGFDLLFRALQLPPGSEILFTAITVPGMVEIARHHGLIPVPVDIDRHGHVCLASLESAISDRSRMLVVAHLFGGRAPLADVKDVLSGRGILLVEDCAQSFTAVGQQADLQSDVVMHSFGPIKTATALGGAIIEVRPHGLFREMQDRHRGDPVQSSLALAKRVMRFAALKLMTLRVAAAALFTGFRWLKIEPDRALGTIACGFSANDLIPQIRRQPSAPQLRLLARRLRNYNFARIAARAGKGRELDEALGIDRDPSHSYWAYPLWVENRERVRNELRRHGIDATWMTRLIIVPPAQGSLTPQANEAWSRVLFLPCYAELTDRAVEQVADIITRVGIQHTPLHSKQERLTLSD